MPKEYKIYKTTCLVNGKIYVGQTSYVGARLKHYLGGGSKIKKAIEKFGRKKFKKEIIFICADRETCNQMEQLYIKAYGSIDPDIGYNIQIGGGKNEN